MTFADRAQKLDSSISTRLPFSPMLVPIFIQPQSMIRQSVAEGTASSSNSSLHVRRASEDDANPSSFSIEVKSVALSRGHVAAVHGDLSSPRQMSDQDVAEELQSNSGHAVLAVSLVSCGGCGPDGGEVGRERERAKSDAYLAADGGGERVPNSRKSDK